MGPNPNPNPKFNPNPNLPGELLIELAHTKAMIGDWSSLLALKERIY